MRKFLDSDKPEAAEAIDLFTLIAAKNISAMATTLNDFDCLVFTGGIGEHAAQIRAAVCARLSWLGLELHPEANEAAADTISAPTSRVEVRVIPTNEEEMIALNIRRSKLVR